MQILDNFDLSNIVKFSVLLNHHRQHIRMPGALLKVIYLYGQTHIDDIAIDYKSRIFSSVVIRDIFMP